MRKSKFPATDHDEAMRLGDEALQRDKKGMFRFNPGKEGKTVPDYNPYTTSKCKNCDVPKGNSTLARGIPPFNQLCSECKLLHQCKEAHTFTPDKEFGSRLQISKTADESELSDNLRAAKVLLTTFPEMEMHIRGNIIIDGIKNPEYLINGIIADRKGVESIDGIKAGFNRALEQGCSCVVIDLDMWPQNFPKLQTSKLAQKIQGRYRDFVSGQIKECFVIFDSQAIKVDASIIKFDPNLSDKENRYANSARIESILKKIRNNRSNS